MRFVRVLTKSGPARFDSQDPRGLIRHSRRSKRCEPGIQVAPRVGGRKNLAGELMLAGKKKESGIRRREIGGGRPIKADPQKIIALIVDGHFLKDGVFLEVRDCSDARRRGEKESQPIGKVDEPRDEDQFALRSESRGRPRLSWAERVDVLSQLSLQESDAVFSFDVDDGSGSETVSQAFPGREVVGRRREGRDG